MESVSRRGLIQLKSPFSGGRHEQTILSERSIFDATQEQQQQSSILNEKTDMLYPLFLEILQGRTSESFDMIQDMIQTCAGVLEEVQKDIYRVEESTLRQRTAGLQWLELELKTWKLLYALYKDRITIQGDSADGMDIDVLPLGGSEKEVIAQLYSGNSTLREYQLIVDWLEACYTSSDVGPLIANPCEHSVGWENTLFQLLKKRQVAFTKSVEIVKSLDPDAPIREKRPLHTLDEEDDLRLSRAIFVEIRQGRIDEAMALCKYCGQTWRAAILEGWRLHEDPNYDVQGIQREKLPIEGNPRRDLWKKCAWMMADSKKHDQYTRAIAGAFCGHLEALKSSMLSSTWEDLLWAYLKVQIDIRVESEIRACCNKSYLQMPAEYWNGKMSLEKIFEELSVHKDADVRDYSSSKIGVVQRCLILDNFAELLQQMRHWIDGGGGEAAAMPTAGGGDGPTLSAHMLRFLTHIILFMRQIGRMDKEDVADRIIARYIECLIVLGDAQLVAFYTATLPHKMQVVLFAKFLEGIRETTLRSAALESAINAGLDVESATRQTVETIRQRMPRSEEDIDDDDNDDDENSNELTTAVGEISAFDDQKIRALEWLTFLPAQRGELLWQANALIRTFLGESKTECVRAAYEMVPADTLTQIINFYGGKDNLPAREECSVKEFLAYKIYLVGIDSFNEWSRLYHNRPKEPELVTDGANFTERVASEHKEQAYRSELNRWTMNLEDQTKVARDALFNILLFPDKGWLIDPELSHHDSHLTDQMLNSTEWENRQIQLEKLRCICIPEIVLLLHKVMHMSEDYQGCLRLADEIAAESRKLYKVYTKHKLAELLNKLANSSLKLLDQKLDPWGCNTSI